jgi:hypothetical protein
VFKSLLERFSEGLEIASTFWLNKRSISILELPLPHAFRPRVNGWEVEFAAAGRMSARLVQGGDHQVDVKPGDRLIANGEEIYLAVKT